MTDTQELKNSIKELYENRNETNKQIVVLEERQKETIKDVNNLADKIREELKNIEIHGKEINTLKIYTKIVWGILGLFGVQTVILIFWIIKELLKKSMVG